MKLRENLMLLIIIILKKKKKFWKGLLWKQSGVLQDSWRSCICGLSRAGLLLQDRYQNLPSLHYEVLPLLREGTSTEDW